MVEALNHQPLVEIGWLVAGSLDTVDWQASQQARESVLTELESMFPQFRWRMPVARREELAIGPRVEPAMLLEHGLAERNAGHWDFTVIITPAELVSHYQGGAIAVVSRSLDSAVISTAQLDPRATDPEVSARERQSAISIWLRRLVLYSFGRLCGLAPADAEPSNLLYPPAAVSDIAQSANFNDAQREQLGRALGEIADRRLEETAAYQQVHPWRFYLLSSWVNRRDIAASVWEARPWQFPFRLSRLTTAALSATLVLMITAEVWELALSQARAGVALLSLVAVGVSTTYVMLRQGIYIRRGKSRLTEQIVATNVAMALVVLLGMTTTYLMAFGTAFLLGPLLFHPRLVTSWSSQAAPPLWDEYLLLSVFVAALALFIGALGATFESNDYFRHITLVDEEI
jgi:hypothetical protein